MIIHPDRDSPNKTAASTDLHSPVGASISAYVSRKLVLYTETGVCWSDSAWCPHNYDWLEKKNQPTVPGKCSHLSFRGVLPARVSREVLSPRQVPINSVLTLFLFVYGQLVPVSLFFLSQSQDLCCRLPEAYCRTGEICPVYIVGSVVEAWTNYLSVTCKDVAITARYSDK